ncbi:MAG TPA: PIG-L family deacetylase [Candidatus Saccharimonadia bacterium]|nr:PIG-L family deacetylase [Candidatus Saccharimonadia bacterium]
MSKQTKPKSKTNKSRQSSKKQSPKKQQNNWRLRLSKRTQIIIGSSVLLVGLAIVGSALVLRANDHHHKQTVVAYIQSMYTVADVLSQHPKSTLVSSKRMLNVLHPTFNREQRTFALNACPSANDVVAQKLQKQSIAILLVINNSPGPRQCTLAQIVQAYGRPNSSMTLTGSLLDPKEVLMFYDNGPGLSGPLKPVSPPQAPATVVPITLDSLASPVCTGKAVLSFVAHQDDDLLFMNPDHLQVLRGGGCLRTVYLTAGDDGWGSTYWLAREKGAEAAYDTMAGHGSSLWIERYILVNGHEYIRMASPRGKPGISLIFVRLPDGNMSGDGFLKTHHQSLAQLESGAIGKMTSVDGQSSYTKDELANLLVRLMQYYHPSEIDTQTPPNEITVHLDHSDHVTTGQFVTAAYAAYAHSAVPLVYYTGYPISQQPQNVSDQDLAGKSAAFYAYALHDNQVVCKNEVSCTISPYAQWLGREYTYPPKTPPAPPASDATTPPPVTSPPST